MVKKGIFVVLATILVVGLFISGCKQTSVTTAPSSTTTPSSTTAPTTTQSKYGGTLRIIQGAEVRCLGYPPESGGPEDYYQRVPCLETLIRLDEKGEYVPLLAESYATDTAAKTVTIKLKQGIKFHDGTTFDAKACKWNMDQQIAAGGDWMVVSSVEVLDDYTVKLNVPRWDSSFDQVLAWETAMISPTAFEKNGIDWARINPVGTGPFKLASFQRDVQKVFEKFDGYWQQGKPYLDKIVIDIIADPTVQMASFLKGEHDIFPRINPTDAVTLKGKPNLVFSQATQSGDLVSLMGDSGNANSPFSNLKVRQAMTYAIDCKTINEKIYKGYGIISNQANSPTCWSYNPNVVGYPYNPEKAKALLKEAGYASGFNTNLYYKNEQVFQDLFTAIQGYLADVGINVELQALNAGAYAEKFLVNGWSDGLLGAEWGAGPQIGWDLLYFFPSWMDTAVSKTSLHNQEMDTALRSLQAAGDRPAQKTAAWEVQRVMTDVYCAFSPIIFLFPIAVKYSYVMDDYSCTIDTSIPWTFADAWLKK